jgi:hypothetical protein
MLLALAVLVVEEMVVLARLGLLVRQTLGAAVVVERQAAQAALVPSLFVINSKGNSCGSLL